jgi:MarR family transcriptional regulator, 2-MHQ and catechol-resistance regulon repressor
MWDVTLRDDPRITTFGMLAETFLGLGDKLETQLAEFDLKPLEFEVILRLGRSPNSSLRMTDLAAQAHITTSGVTRIVDRLEHDGLVRRVPCESDRRGSFAQLTAAGEKRLDAILPGHVDLLEHWFTSRLTDHDLTSLLAILRKVRDAVNPHATAGIEVPGR